MRNGSLSCADRMSDSGGILIWATRTENGRVDVSVKGLGKRIEAVYARSSVLQWDSIFFVRLRTKYFSLIHKLLPTLPPVAFFDARISLTLKAMVLMISLASALNKG